MTTPGGSPPPSRPVAYASRLFPRHTIHQLAWIFFGLVGVACGRYGDQPVRSLVGGGLVLTFVALFVVAIWTEPSPTHRPSPDSAREAEQ